MRIMSPLSKMTTIGAVLLLPFAIAAQEINQLPIFSVTSSKPDEIELYISFSKKSNISQIEFYKQLVDQKVVASSKQPRGIRVHKLPNQWQRFAQAKNNVWLKQTKKRSWLSLKNDTRSSRRHSYMIIDSDISTHPGTRKLSPAHCYYAKVSNGDFSRNTNTFCMVRTGFPKPDITSVDVNTYSMDVEWESNYGEEAGFIVSHRRINSGEPWTRNTVEGRNIRHFTIPDLSPNTEYYVSLSGYDEWGSSLPISTTSKTNVISTSPPSEESLFTLDLIRQNIVSPNTTSIPYAATFPIGGLGSGRLVGAELLNSWPTLAFPKVGFGSADCDNPSSIEILNSGGMLTPNQIENIFGLASPNYSPLSPIVFLACAAPTPPILNRIPLKIKYIRD